MKTADRILLVSLELFNQHGEANVSSVDIAIELDISPGNLYYHFKGKESIITSLFALYQSRMTKILQASETESLTLEEFFYYLLLIFQASHDFRFLYRNPAEINEKYSSVAKGFKRILMSKERIFSQYLNYFNREKLIIGDSLQLKQMVEMIGLIGTQTPNYQLMKGKDINDGSYIYQSLSTILFSLTPYMNMEQQDFVELHDMIKSQQM
jgi:AcrR family transcriptional regulator